MQASQHGCVNLVGLYLGPRDRADLQRVGDHDTVNERCE